MWFIQILFALSLSLIISSKANAEETRDGIWLGAFGKFKISDSLSIWSEAQQRETLDSSSIEQTVLRAGLLTPLNEHHEVGALMGYVHTNSKAEYRPTLQHSYRHPIFEGVNYILRTRYEFRELEGESQMSQRLRLSNRIETSLRDDLLLVTWDEPFFNVTHEEWTGDRTFERNRAFVGLRKKFDWFSIESGYLNQFIPRDRDIVEHLGVVYFIY